MLAAPEWALVGAMKRFVLCLAVMGLPLLFAPLETAAQSAPTFSASGREVSTTVRRPDGTREVTYPDGRREIINPDGTRSLPRRTRVCDNGRNGGNIVSCRDFDHEVYWGPSERCQRINGEYRCKVIQR